MTDAARTRNLRIAAALAALYVIWGTTYLVIRHAVVVIIEIASVALSVAIRVELVVVDDESGRETIETLDRISRENASSKSMLVLRLGRAQGACGARNHALNACEGKFVTGLDDDDYFLPDRIARFMAAFDPSGGSFAFDGYVRETVLPKRNIVGNQVFTLTERLREVGGFDPRLPAWQDYDLWIRLVKAFGEGQPAGGCSYVHTVDSSVRQISGDREKIARAFDIFLDTHAEYSDKELCLCLRMAKACYGIDALTYKDIPDLLRLGAPRHVLFALYSYLANRWASSTSR